MGQYVYRYNGQVINYTYGVTASQIWLDEVACTGDETDVLQCRHAGWGQHDCSADKDVAISCYFDSSKQYAGQQLHLTVTLLNLTLVSTTVMSLM